MSPKVPTDVRCQLLRRGTRRQYRQKEFPASDTRFGGRIQGRLLDELAIHLIAQLLLTSDKLPYQLRSMTIFILRGRAVAHVARNVSMRLQRFGQQIRVPTTTLKECELHARLLPAADLIELRPRFEQTFPVHLEVGLGIRRKVVALVVLGERWY